MAGASSGMSWRDPEVEPDPADSGPRLSVRDWRIDVLRGLAMLFVLIDHPRLHTLLNQATEVRLGFVSGAEMFVLLSGVVLGMVHERRCRAGGWTGSRNALWRRARQLYVATVTVTLLVYAISFLPWLATRFVTSNPYSGNAYNRDLLAWFEDSGPLSLLGGALSLQVVPWPVDILGLYVLLCLLAPVATRLLMERGGVTLLIFGSVLLWSLVQVDDQLRLPLRSEGSFPVLAWQLLFVLGLSAGWHRRSIGAVLTGRYRRWVIGGALGLEAAFVLLSISEIRLGAFGRQVLEPARVVNVLVAVLVVYVALAHLGRATRVVRLVLEPFGRNSLYVFLVHVPLLVAVRSLKGPVDLSGDHVMTLVHLAWITAVWLLVRHRVGFRFVPR